jgi:selenocysteine-specific elongation factor
MVVVSDPELQPASMLDVEMNILAGVATIPSGSHVRLSLGTAEVLAVADVIGGDDLTPGTTQFVQLRTEAPILALPGDRFIIRRESPLETLGGGVVLDPWAARAKRKNHDTIASELIRLTEGEADVLLDRAGPTGLSRPQASLRNADSGVALGDRVLHPNQVERLTEHLKSMLSQWHRENPLAGGAPRRAMHTGLTAALTERAYDSLIHHACEVGFLVVAGPTIRLTDFSVHLDDAQAEARDTMIAQLQAAGLEGVLFSALIQQTRGMLQLLLDEGLAERVGDRVLHTDQLIQLKSDISSFFAQNPRLSPSDFKALTGQSRRTAIPLLEWLDSAGITRRDGDARVAC